ncbi:kinase-like domain-containing protein [Mucidula mucida]|nr:kinase-like domain-containing protein [Mucidula mucida]
MSSDDEGLSTSTPFFSCRGNRASSSPDSLPEVLAMEAEAHNPPRRLRRTRTSRDLRHTTLVPRLFPSSWNTPYDSRWRRAHGNDGKQYAVKIVKKPQILLVRSPSLYISTIESEGTQKQNTGACDLFRELAILRKLRDMSPQCPFICDFVEACQDENAVYMIMPLYEPLSFDHTISPDEFRTFAFQAVLAIDALHKNGIVHRDIKPENFVRHTSPSGDKVAVVIDFGMANSGALSNATGLWVAGNCGTVVYFASEMMKMLRNPRKEIYIPPYDGEKLDVHALGVTLLQWLWAILHVQDMKNIEYVPVYETGHARYNRDILRIDIEKALHLLKLLIADREDCIALSEALELIAEMTCPDPLERFGLEQVKSHAYFKGCRIQAGNSDLQLASVHV